MEVQRDWWRALRICRNIKSHSHGTKRSKVSMVVSIGDEAILFKNGLPLVVSYVSNLLLCKFDRPFSKYSIVLIVLF